MDAAGENAERGTPQTLGQTLAAERERQGLSRADAAQRLHMSAWQIEALETGDFARLPKGTFLRGFVRNYAKVLGLAPESVMPLLVEDAPVHGRPGIVVPTQNIRFDPLHERLQSPYVKAATIAVVVIAVALAGMYWWVFIRPSRRAGWPTGTPNRRGCRGARAAAASRSPVVAAAAPQGGTPDEPQPAGAAPARMAAVPAPGKAAAKPAPPKDAPKPAPGKDATKDTAKDATTRESRTAAARMPMTQPSPRRREGARRSTSISAATRGSRSATRAARSSTRSSTRRAATRTSRRIPRSTSSSATRPKCA